MNGSSAPCLASEPVSAIEPGVGGVGGRWNEANCAASYSAAARSSGTAPSQVGVEAHAQQLGVDVGALELGGDIAQVAGGERDAVGEGARRSAGLARRGGAALRGSREGVQAVHDLEAVGMAGEEIARRCAAKTRATRS